MGFCSRRHFLLTICTLQIITVAQKQVFDFLGYLWISILLNFFEIIFVIFGIFGAYQYRPKYVISYTIWHVFWLGWNIFIICLYLDIGILNHKECIVIKLDKQSESWWVKHGPGCKQNLSTDSGTPTEYVSDCILDYQHVEIFQAGLQAALAFLGLLFAMCLQRNLIDEDDTFKYINVDVNNPRQLELKPTYADNVDILRPYPSNSTLVSNDNKKHKGDLHSVQSNINSDASLIKAKYEFVDFST